MARILSTSEALLLIFFLSIFNFLPVTPCISENPCLCQIDEYNKINLSPLSQKLKIDEWFEDDGPNGNRFYFHGCSDGDFNATNHKLNFTKPIHGSLVRAVIGVNSTNVEELGKSNEIKITPVLGEKNSYQIVYKKGENITASIQLFCINGDVSFIKLLSADGPVPSLALSSPYACIETHHPGLSTGSVLLIILFITLGIYFLGGCLILYFIRGARGLEVVPNIDFWRSLPGLIKDGLIFLFSGCNPTAITTPETYDRI